MDVLEEKQMKQKQCKHCTVEYESGQAWARLSVELSGASTGGSSEGSGFLLGFP